MLLNLRFRSIFHLFCACGVIVWNIIFCIRTWHKYCLQPNVRSMTLNSNSKSHFTYHLLVILITIVIITTITMHTNKQLSLLHGEKRTASIVTGCSFILVCQDKEKKKRHYEACLILCWMALSVCALLHFMVNGRRWCTVHTRHSVMMKNTTC